MRFEPFPIRARSRVLGVVALVLAVTAAGSAHAGDAPVSSTEMQVAVRRYYGDETKTSFLFVGYGAVTGGAGAVALTETGDFAHGFGWSSLVLGSLTVLGGAGYGVAAKIRGDYYAGLAETDPAQFKREEADRIRGTNQRFALYLGSEIVETLAGIGCAVYGLAAKNALWKGIGVGTAIQGIGLFVIDVPGARRASRYEDQVRAFNPQVGVSVGGGDRPWALSLGQKF